MNIFKALCFLLLCAGTSAHAATEHSHNNHLYENGIAMNGAPALSASHSHFSYANPDAPKGGTLKRAEIGIFDTLNPFSIKGKAAAGLPLIYDKLMARNWDEPFTLYPLIAQSIEVLDDRSEMIIHINPLARFNDGQAIQAADIIFSFETLKEKGRPNMRRIYRQVETIKALDNLSVQMVFGPDYSRETVMIMAMMPVLSQSWWQDHDFDATLLEMPNSSGPYMVEDISAGSRVRYIRNPHYWGKDIPANKGLYNFDQIDFEYYRDENAVLESFIKGNISLLQERDARKWQERYNYKTIDKLEFSHGRPQPVDAMIFNLRRPIFDDIRVRRALFLAFDGGWVRKNLFQDQVTRTYSYFPNAQLSAELPDPAHNMTARARLKQAQSLLRDAGWSIQNNILVKDGTAFDFEIIMNESKDEKVVLSWIQSLQRLGITARARTLDSATFQNRLLSYDYDMVVHKWQNSLSPGTEQMVYWSCDAAAQTGRFNYAGICDPEIDRAAHDIANVTNDEALIAKARELDRLLINAVISIPLFHAPKDYIAVQKDTLSMPETTPLYGPVIESWWDISK